MSTTRETVRFPITVAGRKATFETHANPHADELVSLFLIEERGTDEFMRRYAKNGVVTVGIGNGPLDDHRLRGQKASSARLVAEALGLLRDPRVAGLISYVHGIDSEGGDLPFNLCSIIKLMGQMEYNQLDVLNWACRGFWAKINELEPTKDFSLQYLGMLLIAQHEKNGLAWLDFGMQAKVRDFREFHVNAKAEFEAHAHTKTIHSSVGDIRLCWVESDSPAIARYARSEFGASAHIVVVKKSSGNVAIQVDKRLNLDIRDLVATIKLEEQMVLKLVKCDDPDLLRQDGTIDESWDVWHFAHGSMLLNGSHTAKGIRPTAIPFDMLLNLIETVLDPNYFEPSCSAMCLMGICACSASCTPCNMSHYKLARCCAIRAAAQA